jgi:2-hydroxy-3-oxopropionate reductase
LIVAGVIELVGEALVLLDACGVDAKKAIEVLRAGLAGNQILEQKGAGMIARDFRPGGRVDLHHKDLGIVIDLARQKDVVLPLTAVVAQLMASLHSTDRGSLDHSALILVVEELSGRAKHIPPR